MSRTLLNKCCFTNRAYYAALFSAQIALGQGTFQNLNFESANVPVVPPNQPVQVLTSDALPGWAAYADIYQQSQVWYNGVSLGDALVSIIDLHTFGWSSDVIGGSFTVTLDSGSYFINGDPNQGIVASAAIAQTGTIPNGMKTLLFNASHDVSMLQIKFGNQSLPFYALSSGPNYTTYGADVTGLAGQIGELRFTELPNDIDIHNYAFLDDIQFSGIPIPEPGVVDLFGLGALFLGWRFLCKRNWSACW